MGKAFLLSSYCHAVFVKPVQREMRYSLESDLFIFEVKAYWQIKNLPLINFSCKFATISTWVWLLNAD
jgi:hypothetical protein